jgi:hypothetical protein
MKDDSIVEDKYNTGVCADTASSTTLNDTRRKKSPQKFVSFSRKFINPLGVKR